MNSSGGCLVCLDLDHTNDNWQVAVKDNLMMEYFVLFEQDQLDQAGDNECHFCSVIRDGIVLMCRDVLVEAHRVLRGRIILQPGCPVEVEISTNPPDIDGILRFQYYTVEGQQDNDPQWGAFGYARVVPSEVSLERCSRIITEWIAQCEEKHLDCRSKEDAEFKLPSRLLDNYNKLTKIELEVLPQTFQDAIRITRALNLRYLWIDSLCICIIQDDDDDWTKEAASMARIYSNSRINLAATGSADSRGGCLRPRSIGHGSAKSMHSSQVIKPRTPKQPQIFVRSSFESVHHRYSSHIKHDSTLHDAASLPLLTRAWVFQERHLAPRTVHFHPAEMIMECRTSLRCECGGLESVVSRSRRNSLDVRNLQTREILDYWLEVVEEFSLLRLTRHTDRLTALIGVATIFQAQLGYDYLAGLWKDDLARGLLWDVTRQTGSIATTEIRRHETSFLPSWSWASLIIETEGLGVVFPAGHDDSFTIDENFKFVGASLPGDAKDSGDASQGILSVQGHFTTAFMCSYTGPSLQEYIWCLIFDEDIDTDWAIISMYGFHPDDPKHSLLNSCLPLGCLLIGHMSEYCEDQTRIPEKYCRTLILQYCSTGCYKRVGVLDVKNDGTVFQKVNVVELKLQ